MFPLLISICRRLPVEIVNFIENATAAGILPKRIRQRALLQFGKDLPLKFIQNTRQKIIGVVLIFRANIEKNYLKQKIIAIGILLRIRAAERRMEYYSGNVDCLCKQSKKPLNTNFARRPLCYHSYFCSASCPKRDVHKFWTAAAVRRNIEHQQVCHAALHIVSRGQLRCWPTRLLLLHERRNLRIHQENPSAIFRGDSLIILFNVGICT